MSSNSIINPKPCNYNCGTRIYWNNEENAYFEVFTKQKHNCPNRSNNKSNVVTQTTNAAKLTYYKKLFYSNEPITINDRLDKIQLFNYDLRVAKEINQILF